MISIVNTECHVPKTFSDLAKIAAWGRLGQEAAEAFHASRVTSFGREGSRTNEAVRRVPKGRVMASKKQPAAPPAQSAIMSLFIRCSGSASGVGIFQRGKLGILARGNDWHRQPLGWRCQFLTLKFLVSVGPEVFAPRRPETSLSRRVLTKRISAYSDVCHDNRPGRYGVLPRTMRVQPARCAR